VSTRIAEIRKSKSETRGAEKTPLPPIEADFRISIFILHNRQSSIDHRQSGRPTDVEQSRIEPRFNSA
jgi:hypothetical protein